ncbi:hypothetical protein PR003_g19556 [Phytophthora rubi]|uniref:Uncharacterized protein n=1 Tax=Phytophthora rubi TaxID=129364 RepID=A0A6A3HL88_9STRA|nr:hypothetical protein PR002_g27355 [Phytophthora rubi]KAE9313208.1 hypothetical protein PR003_g19556 [Phytophthora rubi]
MSFNTSFPSDQASLYASTGENISAFSHECGDRGLAIALSQHSVESGLDVSQFSQTGDPRTSDGGLISLQLAQQAPASVLSGNSYAEYGGSSSEVAPGSEPDLGGTQGEETTPRPPSKDKDSVVSAVSGGTASEEATADELTFEDFECSEALVQRDGKETNVAIVLKVKGKDTKETKYTEVRAFCARVGIRAYKNKSKAMLLEMIAQKIKNDKVYQPIFEAKRAQRLDPVRKQIQCPFRLMNVMFSSELVDRFIALADRRSRVDLDGPVSIEVLYWTDIRSSFVDDTPSDDFDYLVAAHPALDPHKIDPGKIVPHTAEHLRSIWHTSHAAYKKALVRFTKSGTNGDDFYRFCGGRLDALYVHLHILKRPGLTATVNQELPDEVYYESEDDPKIISESRSQKKSDVAEAIREFVNQRESMEERKYRFLEKKEPQRMEYLEQRSRAESRRAALQEYTFLRDRLRALYRQQEHETSVRIREDIDEEIAFLKSKKQKLSEEM